MNEAQRHLLDGRYRRRIAELEADRDRWEESSGNWQTLYQQEAEQRAKADAVLRGYMVIGTVENFAEMKARLEKVAALEQRARRELVKRDYRGAAVVLADDLRDALEGRS
jgi:uncharacterized protein (DUF3084 family)